MEIKSFELVADGIDVGPALAEIRENAPLWDEITARQTTPGSPHVDTKTIFLRWAADQSLEAVFNAIEAVDYPASNKLPEVNNLIQAFIDNMKPSALGRAILVNLSPGGFIPPHVDEGEYAANYARFHIPLISDEGNTFFSQTTEHIGSFVHMKPGQLWWFDNKKTHWVTNHSNIDRVHLILDARVDGYT